MNFATRGVISALYLTGLFAVYPVEAGVKDKPAATDRDGMSTSTNQTASDSAPIVKSTASQTIQYQRVCKTRPYADRH